MNADYAQDLWGRALTTLTRTDRLLKNGPRPHLCTQGPKQGQGQVLVGRRAAPGLAISRLPHAHTGCRYC